MKKTAAFILAAALLTGCTAENEAPEEIDDGRPDYYEYAQLHEGAELADFAADSEGTVYAVSHILDENGAVSEYLLDITDLDGNTESYKPTRPLFGFAAEGGRLFCFRLGKLCSYNPNTDEFTEICPLEFNEVKKIEVSGDTAFVLGISEERMGLDSGYIDPKGQYFYSGEQVISVDLKSGEKTISPVEYPIAVSAFDGECIIYAADSEGLFFCDFYGKNRSAHDIVSMTGFDLYDSERYIFSAGFGMYCFELCAGTLRGEDGVSLIREDYASISACSAAGYIFYQHCKNADDENDEPCVVRLKNSAYIKKNSKIKFISTNLDVTVPFGCGYTIDYENLSEDEFALTVLSQDKGYDICHVDTYDEYASNIRSKGSFYPLGDIPEVRKYIDKCLPCLKEAATDDNGQIWMIPVSIELPIIVYNAKSCKENGVDIRSGMTPQEYTAALEILTAEGKTYCIGTHAYTFTKRLLSQYMAANSSFDTEIFRDFAEFSKEKINISSYPYPDYFPPVCEVKNMFGFDPEKTAQQRFLFSYESVSTEIEWLSSMGLSFCEAPKIDLSGKNTASCEFLTVNPNSANLESSLLYIAALCEYLSENGGVMLSDSEIYRNTEGLREVFLNSEISFSVSYEPVMEPYINYLSGKISLDEFISQADKRLMAYLGE